MPKTLIVNGTTYEYPVPGEDPGWGEGATDWAEAVTEALSTLLAPGDILQTTFSIANNISIPTNVNGLVFDPGTVNGATVDYVVYRTSTDNPSGNVENGMIHLVYDPSASVGQKWKMSQQVTFGAGITLSILDSGQIQYTSTDIGSAGYSGNIKFRAKVIFN